MTMTTSLFVAEMASSSNNPIPSPPAPMQEDITTVTEAKTCELEEANVFAVNILVGDMLLDIRPITVQTPGKRCNSAASDATCENFDTQTFINWYHITNSKKTYTISTDEFLCKRLCNVLEKLSVPGYHADYLWGNKTTPTCKCLNVLCNSDIHAVCANRLVYSMKQNKLLKIKRWWLGSNMQHLRVGEKGIFITM